VSWFRGTRGEEDGRVGESEGRRRAVM